MINEQHEISITISDIDWIVFYSYYPGEAPSTNRLPEDCHPGSPAEVEISSVYVYDGISSEWDLVEVLRDETIDTMVETILEVHDSELMAYVTPYGIVDMRLKGAEKAKLFLASKLKDEI